MAQQVIDGTLYSPVNAHALRRGDTVWNPDGTYRLTANSTHGNYTLAVPVDILTGTDAGKTTWLSFQMNEPVLRAVGAAAGGLL